MSKQEPVKCEAKVCCKATAALNAQVNEELKEKDGNLKALLDEKDDSQNPSDDGSTPE